MNTKCVPLTCTFLSLCLAFNIVWLWLLLYLVMGSFPLQGLGLWRFETKKIDLRKTVLRWNCETLHWRQPDNYTVCYSLQNKCRTGKICIGLASFPSLSYKFCQNCAAVRQVSDLILKTDATIYLTFGEFYFTKEWDLCNWLAGPAIQN